MTAKLKKNSTAARTAKPNGLAASDMTRLHVPRDADSLNASTLARMLGVSEATLTQWHKGAALDAPATARLKRLDGILTGLGRVMKKSFIPTWLTSPNDACDGRAPADLLAQGDYESIEDIVYFLEAGEPV